MNFSRLNLWIFGGISLLSLGLLVALPGPGSIDRRTGERITTPAAAVEQLRTLGDAGAILGAVPSLLQRWPDHPELLALRDTLQPELQFAKVAEPIDELDRATLLATLAARDQDPEVAIATEAYFAPVASETGGVDARAAALRQRHLGEPAPATDEYLALAAEFEAAGRRRAQTRWLRRALEQHPGSPPVLVALAAAYTGEQRLAEALAITRLPIAEGTADTVALWTAQAQLASWLNRPGIEASARERLLEVGEDAATRARLIALYDLLGTPHRGTPHAIAMARAGGTAADFERAIEHALVAGNPDIAFDLLREIGGDDSSSLRRLADLAIQDLRYDLAIEVLEHRQRIAASEVVEARLAGLYRRRHQPRKLAELLIARLQRNPSDYQLGFRVIGLLVGLGELERARELDATLRAAIVDPAAFFTQIDPLYHAQTPGLGAMAMTMASAQSLLPKHVDAVLGHLQPMLSVPHLRRVAAHIVDRFPDAPSSRAFRLELLAHLPTAAAQTAQLERLVRRFPDEVVYAKAWLARIAFGDQPADELDARRILLGHAPDDSENRVRIAQLLEQAGSAGEALSHWRHLAELEDAPITARVRYARALVAAGESEDAFAWVRTAAQREDTSPADKLTLADFLLEMKQGDAAREFYLAYLKSDPNHPHALLRVGQISSWGNDPAGAVPYFRRRLAVSDADRPRVQFHLGEALWSLGRRSDARSLYHDAVAGWGQGPHADLEVAKMVARSQLRAGQTEAAERAYVGLLARTPRDASLHLEMFEMLRDTGRQTAAEQHLATARRLAPNTPRQLRTEAEFLARRDRPGAAVASLRKYLQLHGADAGIYADLGNLFEAAGADRDAFTTYQRWLAMQPTNGTAKAEAWRAADRIASLVGASSHLRLVGDDTASESRLDWSLLLAERTRAYGRVGHGSYSGRAQAVAAGATDVTADTPLLDFAVSHRFGKRDVAGIGLTWHPGVDGDAVGAWAGVHLQGTDPYWSLEFNGRIGELLTDPIAAPGLEGRSDSLEARAFINATERLWAGAELEYRRLGIAPPGTLGRVEDDQLVGTASVGYTWLRSRAAVTDRFRPRRCPPGPHSPYLDGEAADLQLTTWAAYRTTHLRGDEDLLSLLPLTNRSDYATVAARADQQLAPGLGCKLEAFAGADVRAGDTVWGADLETTWRPSRAFEASLGGGMGDALGRAGSNETSYQFRLQLVWRF